MNVQLLAHTPAPEQLVAASAKLCYSAESIADLDAIEADKAAEFINKLPEAHQSPFEHVSFTFGIEGVSRAMLAQITRHRIAAFSVQSQRYVNMDEFGYVIPPSIANACETRMIVTMNARELLHFFSMRCCKRAQWEIRAVADEMLRLCKEVAPEIFAKAGPGCVRGHCPEGKMGCKG